MAKHNCEVKECEPRDIRVWHRWLGLLALIPLLLGLIQSCGQQTTTPAATATPVVVAATDVPPTATDVPATEVPATEVPATATPLPATATPVAEAAVDPTATPVPETADPEPAVVAPLTIGNLLVNRVTNNARWSGTGEPGSRIAIYRDGAFIGETTVDADGNWRFIGDVSGLEPGEYLFTAEMLDGDGNSLGTSDTALLRILAPVVPPAPAATPEPEEEEEEEASSDPVDLAIVDVSASDAPTIGSVGYGMTGTGVPGTQLVVLENGVPVGGAIVQADGTWACRCILPPGEHTLIVQDVNDPTLTSESVTFNVTLNLPDYTPPSGPGGVSFTCGAGDVNVVPGTIDLESQTYVVGQCEYLSLIAERLGTTTADLLLYNPQLASGNTIIVGQPLVIPPDAGCFDVNG